MNQRLFLAAESGNISAFRAELANGTDINQVNENGATPLMIACKFGHTALVQFILSRGANLNLADNNGMTALKNAKLSNKIDLILLFKVFIDDSEDIENESIEENFDNTIENQKHLHRLHQKH